MHNRIHHAALEGKIGGTVRRGDHYGPEVQLEAFDAADFAAILETATEDHIDADKFSERLYLRDTARDQAREIIERGQQAS